MAVIHLKKEKLIVIYCDICFNDITKLVRVKCSSCFYDMCLLCFHSTLTTNSHSIEHAYRVIEPLQRKAAYDWTAFEEILFLDAIKIFGIGNWADISEFIAGKNKSEIEKHFNDLTSICSEKIKQGKDLMEPLPKMSNPHRHEIASYMPLRKDFDSEYENDFENIIKEMRDDPIFENGENQKLKDAILDSYNNLMRIRNYRKYAILEKNLIGYRDSTSNIGRLKTSKFHAPYIGMMKSLGCLLTKNDVNRFLGGLVIERYLEEKLSASTDNCKESSDYLQTERRMSLLLTEHEKSLCFRMQINFKKYLQMKQTIMECYIRYGYMDLNRLKVTLGSSDERISEVLNFFVQNRWISQ